ncbi:Gfo/Idh/MocA family oxidoreductase [bacterium]|nr:MAG: Gfo/Idh/MocA family oxidoreductase [bacterium]
MADRLGWGIIATGSIAHAFAKGLKASKTGDLVASGSRSLEKAEKFAEQHGGKAYGSYDEVLADPDVHAVYIATPHHLHYEWTIKAAEAGKAILCEKPFTLNALEAQRALNEVQRHKVFFMEAFMYRTSPQMRKILELVREGAIGKILAVNAEFGFAAGRDWDNFRADGAVGGGGLMDVGTYCVSFIRAVVGEEPSEAHYVLDKTEKGYDASGAGILKFPGGAVATFGTGVHVNWKNDARIYGENGRIEVDSPWFAGEDAEVRVYRNGSDVEVLKLGGVNLYAEEADAVSEFLSKRETPYMSVQDTLDNMRALDALRASAGFKFASEQTG